MERNSFERLLKQGHGRAILFQQNHDATPYRDLILHACTHNLAYDRQCETRCPDYFFDLIYATNDVAYYRDRLLATLVAPLEDEDEAQIYAIAFLFAAKGDGGVRLAMYTAFSRYASAENFDGAEEIVRLDGFDGFRFVMNYLRELDCSEEVWRVDNLIEILEERYGKADAWRELERVATEDKTVAVWLDAVHLERKKWRQRRANPPSRPRLSYEAIKRLIAEKGRKASWVTLSNWYKKAEPSELAQAAADLLTEENPDRLLCCLRIFWKTAFPGEPDDLIALTQHSEEDIAWAALQALENIVHPNVRKFALQSIEWKQHYAFVGAMLATNFQTGDERLFLNLLELPMEEHDAHWLGMDMRDFCEAHPEANVVPILRRIYEQGICSLCRYFCVKMLIQHDALTDELRAECRFDGDEDIRKLVLEAK